MGLEPVRAFGLCTGVGVLFGLLFSLTVRMWEDQTAARILVEIARQCRRKNLGTSTSDAIAAVAHAQRLAELRNHTLPSREDLLDGVRSLFIKVDTRIVDALVQHALAGPNAIRRPPEAPAIVLPPGVEVPSFDA